MLAFPALVIQTLWCLAVVLTLGAYRTLSLRTLGVFLAMGVLLGVIGVPVVEQALLPFSAAGSLAVCLARQLLLLLPLGLYFARRYHRVGSIADSYLLGFAVGLGSQLAARVFVALPGVGLSPSLAIFPPWQLETGSHVVAGYAYWTGLAALSVAASDRLLRQRPARIAFAGAALLLVVVDAWLSLGAGREANSGIARLVGAVLLHGRLMGWLSLAALVGFSLREVTWVARKSGRVPAFPPQQWLAQFASRRAGAAVSRADGGDYRLDLLRAEAAVPGGPIAFEGIVASMAPPPEAPEVEPAPREPAAKPLVRPLPWQGYLTTAWPWLALVAVLYLLPGIPALGRLFWHLPLIHDPLPPLQLSALNLALAGLIVTTSLRPRPLPTRADDPDLIVRHFGERWLSLGAAGVLLVVLFSRNVGDLLPLEAYYFSPAALSTVLLLLAFAVCRVPPRPAPAPPEALLRDLLPLGTRALAVWLALCLFPLIFQWARAWDRPFFAPTDIRAPLPLQARLRDAPDPVSGFVRQQLSSPVQQMLSATGEQAPSPERLRTALAGELNRVVLSDQLYDPDRFKPLNLPPALDARAKEGATGEQLSWLNRTLLEAAIPNELARRPAWVHSVLQCVIPLFAAVITGLLSFGAAWLLSRWTLRWEALG